jgi:hypothetical protein
MNSFPIDLKDVATVATAVAAIVSALITGVFSVYLKKRADRQVEQLKADLSYENTVKAARVDYEYEARKRLYKEVEPILFVAHRAVGSVQHRLSGLIDRTRDGKITTDQKNTWMRDKYYQRSTAYRLLLPMAYSKLLFQKLSELDFTLEPKIGHKCAALSLFRDIFVDHFDLAAVAGTQIPYDPYAGGIEEERDKNLGRYRFFQGLVRGEEDALLSLMISAGSETKIPIEWPAFEQELEAKQSAMSKAYIPLRDILISFHPTTHPVVWRALLSFLILSEFYVEAKHFSLEEYDEILSKHSWQDFDFRGSGKYPQDDDAMVRSHFEAAFKYIRHRLDEEYKTFSSAITQ